MDAHEILNLEKRMTDAAETLHRHADAVAMARQVKEFNSDQRKNLLAKYASPLLRAGESATAAETHARANEQFQTELVTLAETYRMAEKHLAKWDAEHATFEAARSALSLARSQIQL